MIWVEFCFFPRGTYWERRATEAREWGKKRVWAVPAPQVMKGLKCILNVTTTRPWRSCFQSCSCGGAPSSLRGCRNDWEAGLKPLLFRKVWLMWSGIRDHRYRRLEWKCCFWRFECPSRVTRTRTSRFPAISILSPALKLLRSLSGESSAVQLQSFFLQDFPQTWQ